MKLELHKSVDGTGFVICIVGSTNQIVIPLSPALSGDIDRMVRAEGIKTDKFILPPRATLHG